MRDAVTRGSRACVLEPLELVFNSAKFDLSLTVVGTVRRVEGVVQLQQRPVRRRDDPADAGTLSAAPGGHRRESGAADQSLPLLTEDERQRDARSSGTTRRRAIRDRCVHQLFEEQVERTPDSGGGRVWKSAVDLRRAEHAVQSTGSLSAQTGRGPGDAGRDLRGAVARDGGRATGHSQGGRRLCPARPRLPRRAAGLPAPGLRRTGPLDPATPAAVLAGMRRPGVVPGRRRAGLRRRERRQPASRSPPRTTWPTSSTPPARRACPRGSSSATTTSSACSVRPSRGSTSTSDDVWTMFHSFAFDFSVWEIWGRWSTAAGWWWCPSK